MDSKVFSEENLILCPILSDNYYSKDIETIEVLVSEIKEKTNISKIANYLSKAIELKDLNHLKRIKSNNNCFEVIICVNDNQSQQLLENINEFLAENDLLPLKTREVAKNEPKTQIQFELSGKLWPISYHPNKYIEKCLNSTVFDSDDRKTIFDIIMKAIEANEEKEIIPSMVTIVTDSSHKILVKCQSDVKSHPLRHSVFVAIDQISRMQKNIKSNDYLCTGYDFYLSGEPCLMCCMALVHSRIRRLFFFHSNITQISGDCSDRAITLHKFHLLPKLNHHFESWKISFE